MSETNGVAPAPTRRQSVIDWSRRALIALVLAAAVFAVVRQWDSVQATLAQIAVWQLGAALLATVAGVWLGMRSWRAVIVGVLHPDQHRRIGQVYFVGQLGKYLPGSVWAFILQMEIGKKNGLARAQVFVAALVSTGVSVAASLVIGLLAVPQLTPSHRWLPLLYLALPVLLLAMHPRVVTFLVNLTLRLLRRPQLETPVSGRAIVASFGYAIAMYCTYGIQMWLLVRSRGGIGVENAAFLTGALSLGMTVGVLAFILPSGLGAREAVLVAALTTVMPSAAALAFALVSRVMFTVAELVTMAAYVAPELPHVISGLRHRRPGGDALPAGGRAGDPLPELPEASPTAR
jgi:hypothetical protein